MSGIPVEVAWSPIGIVVDKGLPGGALLSGNYTWPLNARRCVRKLVAKTVSCRAYLIQIGTLGPQDAYPLLTGTCQWT